ncbi:12135_t:CDS:2 [Gigaspora margarita]|uniref:12135_t:CDS:1 n=1 Tax=Gigaspora margarita TaxID=4874 RepID=A0ABN7UT29_GIGMA|nr:12135_t:CDS:2 [Gigaspora margarita]
MDDLGPIYPIEVTMSPNPPAVGNNVFTISGNFSFSFENIMFNIALKNSEDNAQYQYLCQDVEGCTSTNDSFKLPIKFILSDQDVISKAYSINVIVSRLNPYQTLGCVNAFMYLKFWSTGLRRTTLEKLTCMV